MSERLKISRGGQISLPARVRHRWRAEAVVVEDHGDHVVLRPEEDDPIGRAAGAFKDVLTMTADAMKEQDREEELEIERRKFGAR